MSLEGDAEDGNFAAGERKWALLLDKGAEIWYNTVKFG